VIDLASMPIGLTARSMIGRARAAGLIALNGRCHHRRCSIRMRRFHGFGQLRIRLLPIVAACFLAIPVVLHRSDDELQQ
jgi:hypothetical protein